MRAPYILFSILTLQTVASAQGPTLQSPGMPRTNYGQTDRFSNEFNPAFGGVLDLLAEYLDVDADEGDDDDGLDFSLRTFELTYNAWVDPNAWTYAVVVADEDEVELEEAAVHYVGFEGNSTVRAGRFFVDFGKQMQAHVHDLPYFDRPLVLAEYLGEELAGTGVQYDNWFSAGESGAVRFSLALFESLAGEGHGHGEEEEEEEGAEVLVPDLQDVDELNYTARLTGFHDVGKNGVLQWGLSLRGLPELEFEDDENGLFEDGFDNHVYGVDLTYGTSDETGEKSWTFGGEYLFADGDLSAEVDDPDGTPGNGDESLEIFDDDVSGYYLWGERQWNANNSVGLLYSAVEHPEEETPEDSEVTLFYTRNLSEFSRLRFGVSLLDRDEGDDEAAFLVQFTNFIGPHSHGVNW